MCKEDKREWRPEDECLYEQMRQLREASEDVTTELARKALDDPLGEAIITLLALFVAALMVRGGF